MKILQLCNKAPYPANDGSSIAIYNLANGLADNAVELHMLCVNTQKHFKPDSEIPVDFKIKTNYQSIYKNTNTSLFGALANLFSNQSYFVSRFLFKAFESALIQKLKESKFDIIQLEGLFMASYIPLIKQYSHAKITLRAHNIEHIIWERHIAIEKNTLKKWYLTIHNKRLKAFEINTLNTCDAVICITDEDKKGIVRLTNNKHLYTALTGINLDTYQPVTIVQHPQTLFHFASMDWLPNIEAVDWLLTQVWPIVLQKLPHTQLVLAGRGMPERFKKIANNQTTVLENVPNSSAFYSQYDIMLVPLFSGSGLRIKLVEGLAYGKAIITTSIGAEGIPYVAGRDLHIADTPETFAEDIISVLTNQSIKIDLQKNARLLAETYFNYKEIGKQLLEFYSQLK